MCHVSVRRRSTRVLAMQGCATMRRDAAERHGLAVSAQNRSTARKHDAEHLSPLERFTWGVESLGGAKM